MLQGTFTVGPDIRDLWKEACARGGVSRTTVLSDALDRELRRRAPEAPSPPPPLGPVRSSIRVTEQLCARVAAAAATRGLSASRFATLALRSALAARAFPGPDAVVRVPRGRGTRRVRAVIVPPDVAVMLRARAAATGRTGAVLAEAALIEALESPSLVPDAPGPRGSRPPGVVQNFRLPRGLIERVDAEARRRGMSRSRFMAEALELELHRRGPAG